MRAVSAQTEARLYVIPGSHPAMAARRMLELKGIPYKRIDLMPVISHGVLRALRFPSNTVPSLTTPGPNPTDPGPAVPIAGAEPRGSRTFPRELDRIGPGPPLYPPEPERRAAVEEAELWG